MAGNVSKDKIKEAEKNIDLSTKEYGVELTTSPVRNPAFDVTPARLVTGLITETGVVAPRELQR